MTLTAWRLVQAGHAETAFSGEGGRLYGGRWNHRGVPVVYTAESISLAALVLLVHLEAYQLLVSDYFCIPVEFDNALCRRIDRSILPDDWASDPAPSSTRDIGTAWADNASSVVLSVPSVLVLLETNFLINPRHPDFRKLEIGAPQAFQYDPRLVTAN